MKQHTQKVAKIRTKQKIRFHKKKQFVVMKLIWNTLNEMLDNKKMLDVVSSSAKDNVSRQS